MVDPWHFFDSQEISVHGSCLLTLVPLQLREAANCSCLSYFHYNLIPELLQELHIRVDDLDELLERRIILTLLWCSFICFMYSNWTRSIWLMSSGFLSNSTAGFKTFVVRISASIIHKLRDWICFTGKNQKIRTLIHI